jgi:hypothetical protein
MFLFDNFVFLTNIIVGRSDYEQTGCEEDVENNVNTGPVSALLITCSQRLLNYIGFPMY